MLDDWMILNPQCLNQTTNLDESPNVLAESPNIWQLKSPHLMPKSSYVLVESRYLVVRWAGLVKNLQMSQANRPAKALNDWKSHAGAACEHLSRIQNRNRDPNWVGLCLQKWFLASSMVLGSSPNLSPKNDVVLFLAPPPRSPSKIWIEKR